MAAHEHTKVANHVSGEVNMVRVPTRGHDGGATQAADTQAKCFQPVVQATRGALVGRDDNLQVRELHGVTQPAEDVVSHGNSNAGDARLAIEGGDRYAVEADEAGDAIRVRDRVGHTRAYSKKGEEGLHGHEIGKGCNRVTLANRVTEGDMGAKEAINLDACGGTGKQDSVRINEGLREAHGSKRAQQEPMLDAVKSFSGISKDKAAGQAHTVSIVD
jgi:hypothetical protein